MTDAPPPIKPDKPKNQISMGRIAIWVIVGGLGTLVGPVVGAVAIQWLTSQIGTQQVFNSNLVLGAILVVFVLLVPRGIVPTLGDLIDMAWRRRRKAEPAP